MLIHPLFAEIPMLCYGKPLKKVRTILPYAKEILHHTHHERLPDGFHPFHIANDLSHARNMSKALAVSQGAWLRVAMQPYGLAHGG